MKHIQFFIIFAIIFCSGCENKSEKTIISTSACIGRCEKKDSTQPLSCKLPTVEYQKRKATVLESLRKQILEKKELENGYAFKFKGNDKMIDELTDFAKSERQCCDFFTFNISIKGDTSSVWFEIVGPKEAKEFIKTELEL